MKALIQLFLCGLVAASLPARLPSHEVPVTAPTLTPYAAGSAPTSIPLDQIGSTAGSQYAGNGLSVAATPDGAKLRCVFQRMEGQATKDGLWLKSTADGAKGLPFRVKAIALGRENATDSPSTLRSTSLPALTSEGKVEVMKKLARFSRLEFTEEYSVSMDGVRQDFVVPKRPPGEGRLRLELTVDGARAEQLVAGVRLVLEDQGRRLNYHRLHVTDATGKALPAKLTTLAADRLVVLVQDADAHYPLRIDPTFTDADWLPIKGGFDANGSIYATVLDSSGNLYIGGAFTEIGDVAARYVAKWDGSRWSSLGSGMDSGVQVLAVSGTNLYAGGSFTNAGGVSVKSIAKWDGSNWSTLGSGMGDQSYVSALAVSGTNLYVAGEFAIARGGPANSIAKWNGSSWSGLGWEVKGHVFALAVLGTNLYAGGYFPMPGGASSDAIVKWDGSNWSALGSGMKSSPDSIVFALATSGTNLYAAGNFTNAGGVPAKNVAKWDGSSWSALGSGIINGVYTLAVSGTNLYAGGWDVAKWNGSSWSVLGSGLPGTVNALAVSSTNFYAGVDYPPGAGGSAIARWNGSNWSARGLGINSHVHAVAVSANNLYAGGDFKSADGVSANSIAKWDGNSWNAMGSGMGGSWPSVSALAVSGRDIYAGGDFTEADEVSANSIAKWDGSRWRALGTGMNEEVCALAVSGTNLYAGGNFTRAGGVPAKSVARWNGSRWSALGSGMDAGVSALAVSGTILYAGGYFTSAGGVPAKSVAKWNGSRWSALGSGIDGSVYALAVSGTNLYAGGYFQNAGGVLVNSIAKWDGSRWTPLGSGMDGSVQALAVSGRSLYAGGWFTAAGGVPVEYIAKWNGNRWSALGSGMDGSVHALAVSGTNLYAGGYFQNAGGKASAYIAKALIMQDDAPEILTHPARQPVAPGTNVSFSVTASGLEPLTYEWRKDGAPIQNGARISGVTNAILTISAVQFTDAGNYSVIVSNPWGSVTSTVAILTISSNAAHALGAWAWARPVAQTINTDTKSVIGTAADSKGNVFVTGWFDGMNDFGGTSLISYGGQDGFVAKYNSTGALQWVRQMGSARNELETCRAAGVDAAGNVYVTGGFVGTAQFEGTTLTAVSAGSDTTFVAKYSSNGALQWVRRGGHPLGSSYGTGLTVDPAGNCWVVGYFDEAISWGDITQTEIGDCSIFVAKFDTDGSLQWTRSLDASWQAYSTSIAADASGNCFVGGMFNFGLDLGDMYLDSSGGENGFIVKYTSAGDLAWARQLRGTGQEGCRLGADAPGNCYVVGTFPHVVDFGSIALTNTQTNTMFLAKYSPAGTLLWARKAAEGSSCFSGLNEGGCAVDFQGNSYIPAISSGTMDFEWTSVASRGGSLMGADVLVAKYDSNGNFQQVWTAGGIGDDVAMRLTVDAAGICHVAGWFQYSIDFGTNTLYGQGYRNVFLAQLESGALISPILSIAWSNGIPLLRVSGRIGSRYGILASPALQGDPLLEMSTFTPIATVTNQSVTEYFLDTHTATNGSRFYRLQQLAP